jgi:hypothetical protein
MCLSATAVAENSLKAALQLTQTRVLSGEEALHLEQVCMAELQRFFLIGSVFPEMERIDFSTDVKCEIEKCCHNKKAQARACARIFENPPRLEREQFVE